MEARIIGIDCATAENNIGLALGIISEPTPKILRTMIGGGSVSVANRIVSWAQDNIPTLLSLDAPLGWPVKLSEVLLPHHAGFPINESRDEIFNRFTDKLVRKIIKRKPMDVGADRIARTAHAALHLLQQIREITGRSIPLAWTPELQERLLAIEVYPAATLLTRGIPASNYKKKEQKNQRRSIINEIEKHIQIDDTSLAEKDANVLDAIICVLAGSDFITGKAIPPDNLELAKKEGWIWINRPNQEKYER